MKNLIPGFILENYKNNKFQGEDEAFTLYSDISGFTAMSSKIMKGENEGAEILSGILKKIFSPAVRIIHEHNGFITNFAGDGFISIFLPDKKDLKRSAINVLSCAQTIINELNLSGIHKTRFGNFKLNTKTGLSFGQIEWGIVGDKYKSYYFKGNAVSGCSESLKCASDNEIVADMNFYNTAGIKSAKDIKTIKKKSGYYSLFFENRIDNCLKPTVSVNNISNITKEIFSSKFVHPRIFSIKDTGQFRNVVSLFISFDHNTSKIVMSRLFSYIINSTAQNSGYHKDIDFGDKGGVIVIFFGIPNTSERDLTRALRFLKNLRNEILNDDELKNIELKFGMTFGGAFVGFIGDSMREQYSIIGDTVNLASRLMVHAEVNEVLLNEGFVKNINGGDQFEYIGDKFFKGFSDGVPVYRFVDEIKGVQLKGSNLTSVNSGNVKSVTDKIIGRNKEIQRLNDHTLSIINSKNSGVIYIVGEAGIGKSRLLTEFRKDFSRSNKITWLYCRTSEIIKESLSPLKYLLKNFFKQSSQNSSEENKKLFDNITDIIIKRLDNASIELKSDSDNIESVKNELDRTRSVIGAMIDLQWQNSLHEQLEPELRFENTVFAFCNLILAECILQPVILEIEDIQWLDKDSLKVLNMLLNNLSNLPLAVICTSRFLTHQKKLEIAKDKQISEYEIYPGFFSIIEIKELCEEVLSLKIDEKTAEFILQNTNGNPYFVEQLILDLKERNLFKKKNNILTLAEFNYSGIPQSINNVLLSRFDRLPKDVKEIIMTASVLGREFDVRVLEMMLSEDNQITRKIGIAVIHKICFKLNEVKYYFTHSLLRDAVYGMQMPTELKFIHRQAASAIKKLYAKKISNEKLTQVAYHSGIGYGITGINDKIIFNKTDLRRKDFKNNLTEYLECLNRISKKYNKEYRNEKALEVYDLILKILLKLKDHQQIFKTLILKTEVLNKISRWDEAETTVNTAIDHAIVLKDNYMIMTGNKYLADVYRFKNEFGKSMSIYKKCLSSPYMKQTDERFSILQGMGNIYKELGDFKKADDMFQEQYQISKAANDKLKFANSLYNLGTVCTNTGRYDEALKYFSESLRLSKNFKYLNSKALIYKSIGNVYYFKGDLKKSLNSYKDALKLFKETGNRSEYGNTLGNMGNLEFTNKNFEKAENYYEEQLDIFKKINNISGLSSVYGYLGNLYSAQYKLQEALNNYKMQLKINKSLKMKWSIAVAYGNIGIAYYHMGNNTKAEKYYLLQYKSAKELSNTYGILNAAINLGNSYYSKKNYQQGKMYYEEALTIAEKDKNINYKILILFNLTDLLIKTENFERVLKYCDMLSSLCKNDSEIKLKAKIIKETVILQKEINKIIRQKEEAEKKFSDKTINKLNLQFKKIIKTIREFKLPENTADAYYKLNTLSAHLLKSGINISQSEEIKTKTRTLYNKLYSELPKHEYKVVLKELKD